jgi:hypothetical protein
MTAQEKEYRRAQEIAKQQVLGTDAFRSAKDIEFEGQLGGNVTAWVITFPDGSVLSVSNETGIHFAESEDQLWEEGESWFGGDTKLEVTP